MAGRREFEYYEEQYCYKDYERCEPEIDEFEELEGLSDEEITEFFNKRAKKILMEYNKDSIKETKSEKADHLHKGCKME